MGAVGGGWWWGFGMSLLSLLFLGLIVAGIVLLIRGSRPRGGGTRESSRALDILDERFARGEIDLEEYQARRRLLLGPGQR